MRPFRIDGSALVVQSLLQKFLAKTLCEAYGQAFLTVDGELASMPSFPATAADLIAVQLSLLSLSSAPSIGAFTVYNHHCLCTVL